MKNFIKIRKKIIYLMVNLNFYYDSILTKNYILYFNKNIKKIFCFIKKNMKEK